jgi:uncharacterized metal-binding protein YceD (DUF177 family)
MSATPEFSRTVRLDSLGTAPRTIAIEADEGERATLAARFGLIGIDMLRAEAAVRREGDIVIAEGRLAGRAEQPCVVTGDPVPAAIDEAFALRFVPAGGEAGEEVELDEGDLDIVAYEGGAIDLGEAVAQGFALALDPFPRAPGAGERRAAAGVLTEEEAEAAKRDASPFSALRQLKGE